MTNESNDQGKNKDENTTRDRSSTVYEAFEAEGDDEITPDQLGSPFGDLVEQVLSELGDLMCDNRVGEAWPVICGGLAEFESLSCLDDLYAGCDCAPLLRQLGISCDGEMWGGDVPGLSGYWITCEASAEQVEAAAATLKILLARIRAWRG